MPKNFIIWGRYTGSKKERLDTATDENEAQYLVGEYQVAFGRAWTVWYEER